MSRIVLTDKKLKSLKSAPEGTRREYWDAIVPGLGMRVTDRGAKSFVLLGRFPGGDKRNPDARRPTRRLIGQYGAITLEQARETAREWHGLILKGVDPKEELDRKRAAEQEKRDNTFAKVAEDFIAEKLPGERKGKEAERSIRKDLISVWGKRPITDITDLDVLQVIKAKRLTAPVQARNLLGEIKRLFKWAVAQRVYSLKVSPCADMAPKDIFDPKKTGERILNDDEMFALWRAADRIGYPHGSVYKLLMLTALRLNEGADAPWSEFDLRSGEWTIPAARMKGRPGEARPHMVPLTKDIIELLESLPHLNGGPHLFSTTNGVKPVTMGTKVKTRVHDRMLRTLKALARIRGDDPSKVTLPRWTNHDIRRTVRSNLPRLKVDEGVSEAILAHVKPGIKGVYNKYEYFDEKREALEIWASRLRAIMEPPPPNVVKMQARA